MLRQKHSSSSRLLNSIAIREKRDGSFDDTFKDVMVAGVVHHWDGSFDVIFVVN